MKQEIEHTFIRDQIFASGKLREDWVQAALDTALELEDEKFSVHRVNVLILGIWGA